MLKNAAPLSPAVCRRVLKGLALFAVAFTLLAAARSTVIDWDEVPTASMTPAILEGDWICEDKLAYDLRIPFTTIRLISWGDPKRDDVVVFTSPRSAEPLVKRVVAVPGDEVEIGGSIRVLPAGKYFVLGDNRSHSYDSRFFGPIDRSRILGKALGVISSIGPSPRRRASGSEEPVQDEERIATCPQAAQMSRLGHQ